MLGFISNKWTLLLILLLVVQTKRAWCANNTTTATTVSGEPSELVHDDPDWIDDNPNAFHMFENFELNQKVFIQEQKLVKHLRQMRYLLMKSKKKVQSAAKLFHCERS